jgi:hypothetical protein
VPRVAPTAIKRNAAAHPKVSSHSSKAGGLAALSHRGTPRIASPSFQLQKDQYLEPQPVGGSQMQKFERLLQVLKQARDAMAQGHRDGLPPDEMLRRRERAYRAWQSAEIYRRETSCSPDRVE